MHVGSVRNGSSAATDAQEIYARLGEDERPEVTDDLKDHTPSEHGTASWCRRRLITPLQDGFNRTLVLSEPWGAYTCVALVSGGVGFVGGGIGGIVGGLATGIAVGVATDSLSEIAFEHQMTFALKWTPRVGAAVGTLYCLQKGVTWLYRRRAEQRRERPSRECV